MSSPAPLPPSASSASSSSSSSSSSSTQLLSGSDYHALARLLPHLSAEVIARRFVGGRLTDFRVSELRELLKYLRDHLWPQNPHWSRSVGTRKEQLVTALKAGIDLYRRNPPPQQPPGAAAAGAATAATAPSPAPAPPRVPSSQAYGYQGGYAPPAMPNGYPPGYSGAQVSYGAGGAQAASAAASAAYRTAGERKEGNGYASYPSSSSPTPANGYRPPVAAPTDAAAVLRSPHFLSGRSPYDEVVSVLAYASLSTSATQPSTCRTYLSFNVSPMAYQSLKRAKPGGVSSPQGLYSIVVRLFSVQSLSHAAFDKSFRVKVNAHEVQIPEARKLSKTKKKGIELVRPLPITDFVLAANYVEVENIRLSYLTDMFRGVVVVELVKERDTADIIAMVVRQQVKVEAPAAAAQPGVTQALASGFKPAPKACSVCGSVKELLRCSRCKNEWSATATPALPSLHCTHIHCLITARLSAAVSQVLRRGAPAPAVAHPPHPLPTSNPRSGARPRGIREGARRSPQSSPRPLPYPPPLTLPLHPRSPRPHAPEDAGQAGCEGGGGRRGRGGGGG